MPKRARSRPTPRRSKRERVVDAATRLFLEQGYGSTGMEAIADEAEVSKATLYSYHSDKASLFAEVMLRLCDDLGGHLQLESLVADSPEGTLRTIALHGVQRILESVHRQILQRVVAESREFPELGRKFWETGPGRFETLVARYLADAKRQKLLAIDDPARAASRLVGQVTGMYLLPLLAGVRTSPSDAEVRRDVDALIAGFLASLRR
jgi:TetR/AcrR family transcriptional repressor of mexJK operon